MAKASTYNDKKVVVIGGNNRLGRVSVQLLQDDGPRVMISGRYRETLEDTGRQRGGNPCA